jgi:hypothetical protein
VLSRNNCFRVKAIRITYLELVFEGIQHAMRMRHIAICSLTLRYFSHYSISSRIVEKKVSENKMYVLIFSATFV